MRTSTLLSLGARSFPLRHATGLTAGLALALTACASTPEDDQPRSCFAEHDGGRVHYLNAGRGREALVLVHGWASSNSTWKHQFPAWAKLARVLAVDLPGHGPSDPPAAGYSMQGFGDALAAVMDHAGVERGVIVGHSNGAPVALRFLRDHPERTLALVAIDGTLKNLFAPEEAEAVFAPFRGAQWKSALAGMIDGMPGPELRPEDRAAIKAMALAARHEAVIGGFELTVDPNAWSEAAIEVPLLLVLAEQPTWSDAYEAWLRERAPQVDYRVWSGVGHYLHMERPQELEAVLGAFLEANGLLQESAKR